MTLAQIHELLKSSKNYRVLVYDNNDKYIKTVHYSQFGTMFGLSKKEREKDEEEMKKLRRSSGFVLWISPAEYYLDIGFHLTKEASA